MYFKTQMMYVFIIWKFIELQILTFWLINTGLSLAMILELIKTLKNALYKV